MPRLSAPGISTEAQVAAGLRGAVLLAQGRAEGLRHVLLSPQGAARSFWAGAIGLLPFLLIRLLAGHSLQPGGLIAELIGYVLGWVVFPLVAVALVDASGRAPLWPLFVAALNWTNLAQYAVVLAGALVGSVMPGGLGGALNLVALGYALWMEWFAIRSALQVSGVRAALFVVLDLTIGLSIAGVVARLAG